MRVSALLALAVVAAAHAQTFPTKPPKVYVGIPPAGGVDQTARITTAKLGELWNSAITVENKPGAGGTLAAEATAKAAPDGYTLIVCNIASHGIGPSLYRKLGYDPLKDVTYIGRIGITTNVMAVHPSVPATTVAEFIAYAKANPGKLNFASTGPASLAHLAGELFAMKTGTQLVHIPYKGVGAALPDMLSGRTQMSFLSGGSVMGQIRTQKLKALAIASATRSKLMPELPTMIEAGVPGFVVTQWHGLLAPRGTPRPIVDRLHADIVKAVKRPEVSQRLALDGTEPIGSSPKEFGAFLKSERDQWAKVAKAANVQTQ
jgi:tripartite-type tricarboxylate transporter receptor subunit TctC